MKMQHLLSAALALLCALHGASAQGVVSQMGGFSEQVQAVPAQDVASQPSALSIFMQQDQPIFPVAPMPQQPLYGQPVATNPHLMESPSTMRAFLQPKGLLTARAMKVANSGVQGSKVLFGTGSDWSVGTDSAGNFQVAQTAQTSPLINLDSVDTLHLSSKKVEALKLNAVNGVAVRGVQQWQLVASDDFSTLGSGWSRDEITKCGGVSMLGGYCKFSRGEVSKTFAGLPPHKQLKVVASYHFIDRWVGETGFMKLDIGTGDCAVPVWSNQHTQETVGASLCGNEAIAEGKFAAPVEVTVPHSKASVQVSFGSTMSAVDACTESWGISGVEVYVRN